MKVLIAVDESNFASDVIDSVISRSWPSESEFFLLTVVEMGTGWFSSSEYPSLESIDSTVAAGQSRLLDHVSALKRKLHNHRVYGELLKGGAADLIVRHARDLTADLVILGCHGNNRHSHTLVGGVAEAVVHRAPCSVEVIKPRVRITPLEQRVKEGASVGQ